MSDLPNQEASPTPPLGEPSVAPTKPATITSLDDLPRDVRNQLEAEHKRGLQNQIQELTKRAEQTDILRNQVNELMAGLGDDVEVGDVADNVKQTLADMQSDRERLEAANKTASEKLQTAEALATSNRQLFDTAKQDHEFAIHAGPKAVSPEAANLISMVLRPLSTTHDDGSVTVKMDVEDENGHVTKDQEISVEDAVKIMEGNVEAYGTLFKATQRGGTGGQSSGGGRAPSGDLDFSKMLKDPTQFFKAMHQNPALVEQSADALLRS